jgi:hypothetical protein
MHIAGEMPTTPEENLLVVVIDVLPVSFKCDTAKKDQQSKPSDCNGIKNRMDHICLMLKVAPARP